MPGTRKLGRTSDHRLAMLRAMVTFLFENGKIEIAKTNNLANKRNVMAFVTKETVAKKLFDEIAPKFEGVNGGYTRIIKKGPRRGDAAEMCVIELVTKE